MAKIVVVLEWDEFDLGQKWMNIDNLNALLYGETFTKRDLLSATLIATEDDEVAYKQEYYVETPIE